MSNPLEKEFKYYLENQDKLVKKYNGKYVVIKESKILGGYDDMETAINETSKEHELGTFLVQKCTPGNQDYTAIFHSRVA